MTGVGLRGAVRLWLLPVAAVVVVLVLVTALGGFRSSPGAQGRPADAEEVLDLTRWQLVVHAAELVPAESYEPKGTAMLRVSMRVTTTGNRSVYGLAPGVVVLATPTAPLGVEDHALVHGSRSGSFDPDVPQEVTLDFRWPHAPAEPPPVVRVLVHDERQGTNYLFADGDWKVDASPLAHLDLPCPDHR